MKIILLITMMMLCRLSGAQTSKDAAGQPVKAGYGEAVQQTQPEFPGGPDSLRAFLKRSLHYPKQAIADGARGKVWLNFTVDREGNIKDESILKGVNEAIDQEALRLLKLMPIWNPGSIGGNPVDAQYILQIEFVPPGQKPQ